MDARWMNRRMTEGRMKEWKDFTIEKYYTRAHTLTNTHIQIHVYIYIYTKRTQI